MLRPILFKIISTTQLKVAFNHTLSTSIGIGNFKIEAISGSGTDVEILSVQIEGAYAILNTRPHHAKCYYVLKLQDSSTNPFQSDKGISLINDDVSRDIYFIGSEKQNAIRDDIFFKTPQVYNLDSSGLISSVLSAQSDQLLKAQHSIGSLLNDNYISQTVTDEYRVRSAGATDRLSNENAFQITRVSRLPTGSSIVNKTLEIDNTDIFPINLKQELVDSLVINSDSTKESFNGFLVSLPNSNVIKVLYAKLIRADDVPDCYGEIGTEYSIKKFKYSMLSNKYDPTDSFSNPNLKNNQVLFSDFGNWERPKIGDSIVISYLYENSAISIVDSSIEVFEVKYVSNESVPSNSTQFSLQNSPIINSFDAIPDVDGLTFKVSENDSTTPSQFANELIFNFSSLPSKIGEYSVNYETGDVFLVGNSIGEGTGYNYFFVDYIFKNILKRNLDYHIFQSDLTLNYLRPLFNKKIKITFDYELVFAQDVDYLPMIHKEVIEESVENRVTSSFSLKTLNSPITDVFRIYNRTTGEVYKLNYFHDNEVFFTGLSLPKGKEVAKEPSNFKRQSSSGISPSGSLISPLHYGTVSSALTNLNIEFSPGIPSEFINDLTTEYWVRFLDHSLDDYKIVAFYSEDSNGLIKGFSINSGLTLPSASYKIQIGVKTSIFDLPHSRILNKTEDSVGSFFNSSLQLDPALFKAEKFFEPIQNSYELTLSSSGSQSYVISSENKGTLNKNLSRLRSYGDYVVDYQNGVIYCAVDAESISDSGDISYSNSSSITNFNNPISIVSAYKKINSSSEKSIAYSSLTNTEKSIDILDLDASFEFWTGSEKIGDYGTSIETMIVDENYEMITSKEISSIRVLSELKDLFGKSLSSTIPSERYLESTAEEIVISKEDGGKNYYIPQYVSFSNDKIDFKSTVHSKSYLSGPGIDIKFRTPNILSVFSISNSGGTEFLNSDLDWIINEGVAVTSITSYSATEYQVFFDSINSSYSFSYGYDYLKVGSDRWKVNGFSTSGYFIIEKISEVYSADFDSTNFNLIVRPTVSIDTETKISYPSNGLISSGKIFSIKYVSIYSPTPGMALAIEYSSGKIFFDYVYLEDDISISYEYGDNEIDWSINNSISEGESYFVSYRYGALRKALTKNFGSITRIPFFENNSLSIDRELYRDAVGGVLSAFPKGPTISAISGLVQSISKTVPDIKEMQFGSWILGRDFLSPGTVSYLGNLNFSDGKFGSGLKINEDNSVWIPAVSSISLQEGTVEMWITPDWYGVNNDADLTFSFDNVESKKFSYIGGDPFSTKSGYRSVASSEFDLQHGFDFTNGYLRIYKESNADGYSSDEFLSSFGIFKNELNLNREITISQKIEFSLNYSVLPRGEDSYQKVIDDGEFLSAKFFFDNNHNMGGLEVKGVSYKEAGTSKVFIATQTYDLVPDFDLPYPTATCKCIYPTDLEVLNKFNSLEIEIELSSPITKSELFTEVFFNSESLKSIMIMDNLGRLYEVTAASDLNGKKVKSIPDNIYKIWLNRFPINYAELSAQNNDVINEVEFSTFVILKKQISLIIKESSKSQTFFGSNYVWNFDWSEKTKLELFIDPRNNISFIKNGSLKAEFFYTDLKSSDPISEINTSQVSNSIAIMVFGFTSINLYKNILEIGFKFKYSDIYLGELGYHPISSTFTVNRLDPVNNLNGISTNFETKEGIYIGYVSDCLSPVNENIGQWIFRVRTAKYSSLPYDVELLDDSYKNLNEEVVIDNKVTGEITSSGTFGSITKGRRTISGGCEDTKTCSKHFRFLGNKLLDSDGWSAIEGSDSLVIDSLNEGRETTSFSWRRVGTFSSQNSSGIYRISAITDFDKNEDFFSMSSGLTVQNSCTKGLINLVVSAKVVSFDSTTFSLSKDTDILSSGIVIAEINSIDYNIGVSLDSTGEGTPLLSLIDLYSGNKVKTDSFDWMDSNFHKYEIFFDRTNSLVTLYVDDSTFLQADITSFSTNPDDQCNVNENGSFSIMFVDQRMIDSSNYFSVVSSPVLDFNYIEGTTVYEPGIVKLEDSDLFIVSNNVVQFSMHSDSNPFDSVSIDGYTSESDVDEITITSDKDRYLLDTGVEEGRSRLSLFKDGKGFLNFRVLNSDKKNPTYFNLATNIKNFEPGEKHHIAASWRLNSSYERDQMHLFIDGQEVPNLYKFGGYAPIKFNSKFSDVSREVLYDYAVKNIVFPSAITDGVIISGENVISSSSLTVDSSYVGRTIIFDESTSYPNKALTVISAEAGAIAVGDLITFEPFIFATSESAISFRFAPYTDIVNTDISNDKFSIFRKTCDGMESELGGLGYSVSASEDITIINSPQNWSYRYNVDGTIIEFIEMNDSCTYSDSVSRKDISVDIRTYGLSSRRFKDVIGLSGTSLFKDEGVDPVGLPNSRDGLSIIQTSGPRPKNLSHVSIRKYCLYNYSVPSDSIIFDGTDNVCTFEKIIDDFSVSLETVNISKNNDGRYLQLEVDSDNIFFNKVNTIEIYGTTSTGSIIETVTVNKNGSFFTSNRFTSIQKIVGEFRVVDPDFGFVSIINIIEKNSIFVQDGEGDYASIYRFSNGAFILSTAGVEEYSAFELPPGWYEIDYAASLKVSIDSVGDKLFIGNDMFSRAPLLSSIDDFVVLNTMLEDCRPWEKSVSGKRTITEDFFKESPQCISNSTLALIDFENPIEKQSRRLRRKEFLNTENNFKYTLSLKDREALLSYINNEEEFVQYMINIGYSLQTSKELFFECNMAESGPLYNLASYLPITDKIKISPNSVNDSFGQSGSFEKGSCLILSNNNNILRNSEGTIEFWYQPKLDSFNDGDTRVLFESSSILSIRVKSLTPQLIKLASPASKIISIKLISSKTSSDSLLYSKDETNNILFNEISVIESTGRYSKGTGSDKDFSKGSKLSIDGLDIILSDSLPGSEIDVIVSYVPRQYSGERITIYKDPFSRIIGRIDSKEFSYYIPVQISWQEETWHKITLAYNLSSSSKFIKLFVDGVLYSDIYRYEKDENVVSFQTSNKVSNITFSLFETLSQIFVGNNFDLSLSATGLIDNLRLSREARAFPKDSSGIEKDLSYSSNTSSISPVGKDDLTTYIQNFDYENIERDIQLATVIDPKYGIFDFDVSIGDDFNRVIGINNGKIEDLIIDLIGRIKPAHSNANVKFINKKCKT